MTQAITARLDASAGTAASGSTQVGHSQTGASRIGSLPVGATGATGAARSARRIAAVLGIGLAANLLVVDGARAPSAGIAAAVASPAPCCVSGLVPLALASAGLDALRTHLAAATPQAAHTHIAARMARAAPAAAGAKLETLERAISRETRTVRFGAMRVERWIVTAVRAAAARTGADPVFMLALADKESSLRPGVGASTSSAEGLFQFIEQTWLQVVYAFGADHGLADEAADIAQNADGRYVVDDEERRAEILALRRDPLLSGLMAGEMLARDRARIEAALGRGLAPHEVYIAHFLGPGGAERFLAAKDETPEGAAAAIFAAAARANRTIFYDGGNRSRPLSFAEVDARFAAMIGTRIDRYVSVDGRSESARARRLARLLEHGSAVYARLDPDAPGDTDAAAASEADALVLATIAGEEGKTVPLPPRARRGG
ncbi:lytic transglycosylase domain-containing protein [Salinarimonas rosea]|uniref:lytic transglycosylase domain-containing protein n=1 Tax=Salinarimonas rosea TaxID=552063 RepID=UPI00040F50C3|nr:lytic transglycosylase domain-containing protein [Salinarimonas rosea]